jgi:hypothetical protein
MAGIRKADSLILTIWQVKERLIHLYDNMAGVRKADSLILTIWQVTSKKSKWEL